LEGDVVAAGVGTHGVLSNEDNNSAKESGNMLAGLLTPAKRNEIGRPTTSREKVPYDGLSKQTRFCSICRRQGHKRTTCPDRAMFQSSLGSLHDAKIVASRDTAGTGQLRFSDCKIVDGHYVVCTFLCK
jgi:hypothetical protein